VLRRTVCAVLVLLALPGTAAAQSFSAPAQLRPADLPGEEAPGLEGPALAGDQALWLERRPGAAVLVAARAGEAPHDVAALPAAGAAHLSLVADGSTAIVQRVTVSRGRVTDSARVRVDLATGAVTPAPDCLGGACRPCRPREGLAPYTLDLIGSVLAEADQCAKAAGGVVDLADGAARRFPGPVLSAAGRFAVVDFGTETVPRLVLVDWRSGARVRSLRDVFANAVSRFVAVGDDGTVAWSSGGVSVLAPGASRPRELLGSDLDVGQREDQVRIAGGLVAIRHFDDFDADVDTFHISRPDGSEGRRLDGRRLAGGWAFDGRRLAWATQPCQRVVVQVWDLAAAPPLRASETCGKPSFVHETLHMRDRRTLPLTLTCAPAPAEGCVADVEADLFGSRRSHTRIAYTEPALFRLAAGTTRAVHLRVLNRARLRARHRLSADVVLEPPETGNPLESARLDVRVG
jgi:hypothetical protein